MCGWLWNFIRNSQAHNQIMENFIILEEKKVNVLQHSIFEFRYLNDHKIYSQSNEISWRKASIAWICLKIEQKYL